MAKYLFKGRYTPEGSAGLLKEGGTSREKVISGLAQGLGGSLEALYYAFGEDDVIGIVDIPDTVTAAAILLAVNAGGAVNVKITPLITPAEMDAAGKVMVNYRPPGA